MDDCLVFEMFIERCMISQSHLTSSWKLYRVKIASIFFEIFHKAEHIYI